MLCCQSVSEPVLRSQWSANRKSLMMSVMTLVFACSLLQLNSWPSVQYLVPILMSLSLKALVIMAETMRLNSAVLVPRHSPSSRCWRQERTRTPNYFPGLLLARHHRKCCTMEINFCLHPYLAMMFHRPSLLTVSKSLVKSAQVENKSAFCS